MITLQLALVALTGLAQDGDWTPPPPPAVVPTPRLAQPRFAPFRLPDEARVVATDEQLARFAPVLQDLTFSDEGQDLFIWHEKKQPERRLEFVVSFDRCLLDARIMCSGFLDHTQGHKNKYPLELTAQVPRELLEFVKTPPTGYDDKEEYARSLKLEPRAG